MLEITSQSPRQTRQLGYALGSLIKKSAVLALTGSLGSGKTVFVSGLASGLGIKGRVKSPSFAVIYVHPMKRRGLREFFHLDLYRLGSKRDFPELGLSGMLRDPRAVVAIEWPEKARRLLPKNAIHIDFSSTPRPNERRICIKKS